MHCRASPVQPRTRRHRRDGQQRHSRSASQSSRASAVCAAACRSHRSRHCPRVFRGRQPEDFFFVLFMSTTISFAHKNWLSRRLRAPSPRVRGEGRDEGAYPLGSECRRSESLRGPLTLAPPDQVGGRSTSPRAAGRGEKANPFSRRVSVRALQTPFQKSSRKRREAERRQAHHPLAASSGCGRASSGTRSPLGAPPRRLPRKLMPWLSPGRVSCDPVRRALPAVRSSSPARHLAGRS
jgi:hypothetical protein